MTNPYGPPSGPQPQQPYGGYPQSGPFPQQPGYPQQPGLPGGQPRYAPGHHPAGQLAEWGSRVLGYLIDGVVPTIATFLLLFVGALIAAGVSASGSASAAGITFAVVTVIVLLGMSAFQIWNLCYRRGVRGQTLGQQVAKIKTVGEQTGAPVGFGTAFVRQLAHFVDSIALCIGFLAPLWDEKNQTWADKMVGTVVVLAPAGSGGHPQQPTGYPQPGYPQQSGYPQQPGYPPQQQW